MNMIDYHVVIGRYFEAWNTGNLSLFDELLDPNYINHTPSVPGHPGIEGLKYIAGKIREGFPDINYEIIRAVTENNLIAVQTLITGTNTGMLFGAAPTNRSIRVRQMQFEEIKSGKITQHWRITDDAEMQRQLKGITSSLSD